MKVVELVGRGYGVRGYMIMSTADQVNLLLMMGQLAFNDAGRPA